MPKLSWFAFAGGNRLTMTTPSTVKLVKTMLISGKLITSFLPATPRQTLVIEYKQPGHNWATVKSFRTSVGGAFTTTVKPKVSASWRVRWNPIAISSAARKVTVSH